jgi:hypothetical protein
MPDPSDQQRLVLLVDAVAQDIGAFAEGDDQLSQTGSERPALSWGVPQSGRGVEQQIMDSGGCIRILSSKKA